MSYSLKPDVLCPCGCIVNKHYMTKHIKTAEHGREMVGCGNIVRYKPREKKQPQI